MQYCAICEELFDTHLLCKEHYQTKHHEVANDAIYPFIKVKAFSDDFGRISGAEYKWKLHPSSKYCNSWVKLIEYLDSIIKPLLNYLKNSDSHVYVKIGGKMIKLDSMEYIFEEV